jgi:excisionase family DNA binding protein
MTSNDLKLEPIVASKEQQLELAKLEQFLNIFTEELPLIASKTGEIIELPEPVLRLIIQAVHQLAKGNGVIIETFHQPLTIWEAAGFLNIRWQDLEQLIDKGEIPFIPVGKFRRIQFEDVMAYQQKQEQLRQEALTEIVRISEESGLYSMQHAQADKLIDRSTE